MTTLSIISLFIISQFPSIVICPPKEHLGKNEKHNWKKNYSVLIIIRCHRRRETSCHSFIHSLLYSFRRRSWRRRKRLFSPPASASILLEPIPWRRTRPVETSPPTIITAVAIIRLLRRRLFRLMGCSLPWITITGLTLRILGEYMYRPLGPVVLSPYRLIKKFNNRWSLTHIGILDIHNENVSTYLPYK